MLQDLDISYILCKALRVLVLPSTLIFAFFVTTYQELEGIRAKLGR